MVRYVFILVDTCPVDNCQRPDKKDVNKNRDIRKTTTTKNTPSVLLRELFKLLYYDTISISLPKGRIILFIVLVNFVECLKLK